MMASVVGIALAPLEDQKLEARLLALEAQVTRLLRDVRSLEAERSFQLRQRVKA